MASRVTIYGQAKQRDTERIRKELDELSLSYNYYDVKKQPQALNHLAAIDEDTKFFPKVEVACANREGVVVLTNPDSETLKQTLYAEDVLGVTSFWI
jgi:hypothetical protein